MPFDDEPLSRWSIQYWIIAARFFWKDWISSRPRGAWYLIGVVTTVVILFVVLILIPKALRESTRQAYERRWITAEKDEKWAEADLWLQKVISMGDKRPSTRYHLALVSEKLGRKAQTAAIMRSIADEHAFPPAHAWLAAQSLDGDATTEEVKQAIVHLEAAVALNADDERLHLALADAYKRIGELKKSANQLWAVAKRNHAYDLALARLYAEMGDAKGAREHATLAEKYLTERAIKDPENLGVIESTADALILQGKWQEALAHVERRVVDPERAKVLQSRIHYVASQELMKSPSTQLEGVKSLYKALEASPKNRLALLKLARLAPQIVQISPRDAEPIRKWLTLAHEAEPDNRELISLLGMLHMQPGGNLEEAEKLVRLASEHEPILLLDLAQIQERRSQTDARNETLRNAVKLLAAIPKPTDTQSFALAEAQARLGEFEPAKKVLQQALQSSQSALLKTALSQIYFRQAESTKDSPEDRIELFVDSIAVTGGHSPAESALGALAMESPELRQRVVDKANELISNAKAIRGGHMVLGVIAARENQWGDSVFHFEQALNQTPDDAALQNNLAWALAKRNSQGDAKRSLEYAERAVAKAPVNPDLRETRGLAWLVNRQWSPAISDFEFTLSAYPDRKHLHLLLAEAYRGLGKAQLAEKHAELGK